VRTTDGESRSVMRSTARRSGRRSIGSGDTHDDTNINIFEKNEIVSQRNIEEVQK